MDEKHRSILEALPDKSPRSRLEPYHELIFELRQRGRTYREIERILADQCQFKVSCSAINNFVRNDVRKKKKLPQRPMPGAIERVATNVANGQNLPSDEVYRRIAELKQQPVVSQEIPEAFRYDPDEPLHLIPKKNRE
jgi:hypothetical protein